MFSRLTRFGLCIRARLQSCRTGLKQCWALAPAVFSWPSSAIGREKLLSSLVFRAGLATAGAKARILLVCVRTGMSVTEGTGHVGNTFVEVEVKRAWRKKETQVVAEAVGMWEARGCLASFPRQCGKRGKGLLLFLSFHTAVISIALHSPLVGIGWRTSL